MNIATRTFKPLTMSIKSLLNEFHELVVMKLNDTSFVFCQDKIIFNSIQGMQKGNFK